nr:putative ribonuclease H-like domain-containing protein [Tanacetum cinerariifolium]
MMAASKVPMLKPGEFEIWKMRIKQYIQMMDYALWDVIENGPSHPKIQVVEGVTTLMPITSIEDNAQRRLEVYVNDIIFGSTHPRPDIVHATYLCAQYQAKPIEKHLKEVKRIFRYLRGTVNTGLWYTKDSGFELTGFSDADYAGCKDTFKSTSGGAQFLGEKLVSWSSKKQDCTTLSTDEAEYVSLSACCAQVLWIRTQLTDYGFHFNKIPIYCDLKSAIAISCNPVQHSRTKHIAVRYHFIKEHVEKGTIELYFVKTDYQLAGIFTKALPTDRFNYLVCRLGMRSLSPKELERLAKSQVILFSIYSDEWKSFQSQHQIALRIRRWRYNLTSAESKFKTPMLDHQDKYMMKAQVHVSKSSAISDVQTLPQKKLYRQNVKAYIEGEIVNKLSRSLGHLNIKTRNKLVKGNLVRGLPSKLFENVETCVTCQKGNNTEPLVRPKQKTQSVYLHLLHMDLFGPTFVKSLMKKMYCLVVTDDYSRFTRVFFLSTKDETSGILKSFITRIENLVDHNVKVIRCDNETELKNREINQFCEMKGILRQYSVAITPQQNRLAERRNRTLIEADRTMLVDLKLSTTFWAEEVNIACYVQNKVLVVKPHNKTPYELFYGRTPALSFMRPFGCLVTILNTLDHLGKFNSKADEGFFVGYSLSSKAFRVFNSRKRIVEEKLHIRFSENTPNVVGTQSNSFPGTKACDNAGQAKKEKEPVKDYILLPLWIDDLSFSQDPKSSQDDGFQPSSDSEKKVDEDPYDDEEADMNNMDTTIQVIPILTTRIHKYHPLHQVIEDLHSTTQTRNMSKNLEEHGFVSTIHQRTNHKDLQNCLFACFLSQEEPKKTDVKSAFLYGKIEKEKQDGIFISQDKYVTEILRKYGFIEVKNAGTPMETQKPLLKDEVGKEVDVYMYRKPSTEVPQPSDPMEHVADKAVYKALDDRLVRAATNASSLEAEHDNGNNNKTQSNATPNESISQGTDSGGGPRCQEAMGDTIAQTRVLDLEKTKTTQALEIDSLKRRVKKLKKKQRSRTHKLKILYKVGLSARVESSNDNEDLGEDASKQGREIHDIDADEDITPVNDQDDEQMFDVNDLQGKKVFVQEDVADKEVNAADMVLKGAPWHRKGARHDIHATQ